MRTLIAGLILVSLLLAGCGQGGEETSDSGDPSSMTANGTGDNSGEMPGEPEPAAGQRTHAELLQELVSVMSGVTETLNAVSDVEDAKAAITPLEAAIGRLRKANAEAEAMGDPSPEVEAELESAWMPKIEKVAMELMQAQQKIAANPEIEAVLGPILEKLDKALD